MKKTTAPSRKPTTAAGSFRPLPAKTAAARPKKRLTFAAVILLAALLFSSFPALPAHAAVKPSDDDVESLLLYCFHTGTVLYEKNSGEKRAPASTAKMMTALLALEHYPDLMVQVTLTEELTAGNGSNDYGFIPGASLPVRDLFAALVLANANSAANILARLISGSEADFTAKMNEKAALLGMTDTVYQNPTGLDAEGAFTTARDCLALAAALYRRVDYMSLASRAYYTLSNNYTLHTRNNLLGKWYSLDYIYSRATGMNVGSTKAAGETLVATSKEPDGNDYLCIVLGGKIGPDKKNTAYTTATAFLKWGGTGFRDLKVLSKAMLITTLPVKGGEGLGEVPVFPEKDLSLYLADSVTEKDLSYTHTLTKTDLTAPLEKGFAVGEIVVYVRGEEAARCPLVTGADVTRSQSALFRDFLGRIFRNPFVIVLLILLFLFLLRQLLVLHHRRQKKKRKEAARLALLNADSEDGSEEQDRSGK